MPTILTNALMIVLGLYLVACTTRPQISHSPEPVESIEQLAMAAFAEMDRERAEHIVRSIAELPVNRRLAVWGGLAEQSNLGDSVMQKMKGCSDDLRSADRDVSLQFAVDVVEGLRRVDSRIERELDILRAERGAECAQQTCVRCLDVDLDSNVWIASSGYSGVTITSRKLTDSHFALRFTTWGCTDRWTLDRVGMLHGNIVTLDRPVREYWQNIYDRIDIKCNVDED